MILMMMMTMMMTKKMTMMMTMMKTMMMKMMKAGKYTIFHIVFIIYLFVHAINTISILMHLLL